MQGRKIVFNDGWLYYASGTGVHRVSHDGVDNVGDFSVSPDGEAVAYTTTDTPQILFVYSFHSGHTRRIDRYSDDTGTAPKWLPHRKATLIFSASPPQSRKISKAELHALVTGRPLPDKQRIAAYDASAVRFTYLTQGPKDSSPYISPDGRWIAFERTNGIWTLRLNSRLPRRIIVTHHYTLEGWHDQHTLTLIRPLASPFLKRLAMHASTKEIWRALNRKTPEVMLDLKSHRILGASTLTTFSNPADTPAIHVTREGVFARPSATETQFVKLLSITGHFGGTGSPIERARLVQSSS